MEEFIKEIIFVLFAISLIFVGVFSISLFFYYSHESKMEGCIDSGGVYKIYNSEGNKEHYYECEYKDN